MLKTNLKLKISSRNKNSIQKFCKHMQNFEISKHTFSDSISRKNKTFLSVLKSPHIYKTGQEQFERLTYSTVIYINFVDSYLKFLIMLKFLTTKSFFDVYIKISFLTKTTSLTYKNFLLEKNLLISKSSTLIYLRVLEFEGNEKNRFFRKKG